MSYFKSISFDIDTEFDVSSENADAKFAFEFVQMLLSTIEQSDFKNEFLEEAEFFEIINCFSLK